jgi:hypothetical protein
MSKNAQVLNFLKTRAEECDTGRRHYLAQMASKLPEQPDVLSVDSSVGNFDLSVLLQNNEQDLNRWVTQLTIYTSMHRIFSQKVEQFGSHAITDMADWVQVVINDRIADLRPNIQSVSALQAYARVLRFLKACLEDTEQEDA